MLAEADIVLQKVTDAFEKLGVEYMVGGSFASSVHGIPRLTNDVDIVARLGREVVAGLVVLLGEEFYIDADMAFEAIQNHSSFNVIHLATMMKADIFILGNSAWANIQWERRHTKEVGTKEEKFFLYFASVEDMILQKLLWYKMTGGHSDRQWGDVQGMIRVQSDVLDNTYLTHWAGELGISDLLAQSLDDAGL